MREGPQHPSNETTDHLEEWHSEGVAHGVHVDGGHEGEERLGAQYEAAEALAQHGEHGVVLRLHPVPPGAGGNNRVPLPALPVQVLEGEVGVLDVHVEPLPGPGEDLVRRRVGVPSVDHDPGPPWYGA